MRPLLLLVDLQNDFLSAPGLEPSAGEVVRNAARLLSGARARSLPVVHAVTSVDPDAGGGMPHWRARGRRICLRGTPGHEAPAPLAPTGAEPVLAKTFFSAFSSPELDRAIAGARADTLFVAGVHLHGCVRATVLDAYQRGLEVWVAEDAVGSDDPLHAAVTRRYLEERAARFGTGEDLLRRVDGRVLPAENAPALPAAVIGGREISAGGGAAIVLRSPRDPRQALFAVAASDPAHVSAAACAARRALPAWQRGALEDRRAPLRRLADRLEAGVESLGRDLATDIGKPVTEAQAEVRRAARLLRGAAEDVGSPGERCGAESSWRRVPQGVVAVVTPWNNPVAIPVGKIAPALAFGNAVVWKPSPPGTRIALRVLALACEAGLPSDLLHLVAGGRDAALALMRCDGIDAVTLTGSSLAGWTAQEACGRRRVPLQAELGGNNAAIVWEGAELRSAARAIARGAFSFAGQRCTANRRVVVDGRIVAPFLEALAAATGALRWGDPLDSATDVGPLISEESCKRIASLVERAAADAERIVVPHSSGPAAVDPAQSGAYYPPTLVLCRNPRSEIVQEEAFGPVLVVQPAEDFDRALELVNGVPQGLVSALFAGSGPMRDRFLEETRSGILKLDQSTADADASLPFGGWRASGIGPPERGPGDAAFYTRIQTIYGEA